MKGGGLCRAANRKCSDLMANWIWVDMREGREWKTSLRLLAWVPVCMPVGSTGSRIRSSVGRYKVNLEFW